MIVLMAASIAAQRECDCRSVIVAVFHEPASLFRSPARRPVGAVAMMVREPLCSMLRAAPKKRFGPCAQWRGEDVSAGVGSGMGGRGGWSVGDAVPTVDGWDGPDAAAGCLGVSAWTSLGTFFRGGTGTGAA
jgi:hypothetical protein